MEFASDAPPPVLKDESGPSFMAYLDEVGSDDPPPVPMVQYAATERKIPQFCAGYNGAAPRSLAPAPSPKDATRKAAQLASLRKRQKTLPQQPVEEAAVEEAGGADELSDVSDNSDIFHIEALNDAPWEPSKTEIFASQRRSRRNSGNGLCYLHIQTIQMRIGRTRAA